MKFEITKEQEVKYKEWISNHSTSFDCLGTHYSWVFVPTSIGLSVSVQNLLTNEVLDLTEYDKW